MRSCEIVLDTLDVDGELLMQIVFKGSGSLRNFSERKSVKMDNRIRVQARCYFTIRILLLIFLNSLLNSK